jgi:branched-chain amino acid transport system permease protein
VLGAGLIWAVWTVSGFFLTRLMPDSLQLDAGSIQYILIGTLIVTMLLWRPQGLLPERISETLTTTANKAVLKPKQETG